MANYFNTLSLREQLTQLVLCQSKIYFLLTQYLKVDYQNMMKILRI